MGIRTIHHPEIEFRVTPTYTDFDTVGSTSNNATDVDDQAEHYATAEAARFGYEEGLSVGYEGLRVLTLDGLRRQVQWSISATSLPRTRIAAGTDLAGEPLSLEQLQKRTARIAEQQRTERRQQSRKRRRRQGEPIDG